MTPFVRLVHRLRIATIFSAFLVSSVRADTIYLNQGGGIYQVDPNTLVRTTVVDSYLYNGLAIDATAGKIYTSYFNSLVTMSLSGSNQTQLFSFPQKPYGSYYKFSLDRPGDKVYWLDQTNSYIGSASLSGSNQQVLVSGTDANQAIRAFAVDPQAGRIYWGNSQLSTLNWANLDGSGASVIGTGYDNITAIVVDAMHSKLYIGDNNSQSVYRTNLDGSSAQRIAYGVGYIFNMGLNSDSTKLYSINDSNQIYRMNLDGGLLELIYTDPASAGSNYGFAVVAVPEPSSLVLSACGLACIMWGAWRRREG